MAKNKKSLSHIYPKDRRALSILARAGSMSKDAFHKLEITDNRIKSYKQARLIREISVSNKHGNGIKTHLSQSNSSKAKIFPCERPFLRKLCYNPFVMTSFCMW